MCIRDRGILVAGVDLDGERVLGVDKFDEHGKLSESFTVFSQHCPPFPNGIQVFPQGHTVELTAGNRALSVWMGGKLPALRHLVVITVLSVYVAQLCASPKIILEGRRQFFNFHKRPPFPYLFEKRYAKNFYSGFGLVISGSTPHDAQAFSFHTFLKKRYAKNFYSGFGLVISENPPHDAQAFSFHTFLKKGMPKTFNPASDS